MVAIPGHDAPAPTARWRWLAVLLFLGILTLAAATWLLQPGPDRHDQRQRDVPEARDVPHEPPPAQPAVGGGARLLRR
jgi:HAMP domain-containing protein